MGCNRITVVFASLLVFVSVIALVSPEAISQSYSTITTQVIGTSMNVYPTFTQYVTSAYSSFVYGPTGFNLNICGQGARQSWTLNAISGQHYHIEWTAQGHVSLDLYITTAFAGANNVGCNTFPADLALYGRSGVVGSVDWTAPSSGQFIVWLWNLSPLPVSGTISIVTLPIATFTFVSWATTTGYVTRPSLIISTASTASILMLPDFLGPLLGNRLLIGVVIVLVLTVAGILFYRRRKGPSTTRVYDRVVTVPVSRVDEDAPVREATLTFASAQTDNVNEQFPSTGPGIEREPSSVCYCPECGTENVSDSTFCRKCGTKMA
jgi:predicted RNA-binding Zn-ribbon protein involved in translation (DUF1610 family)